MDAAQLPGSAMVIAVVAPDLDRAREVASGVVDPEIPVLTIAELGILQSVEVEEDGVVVTITPTYSGCPAIGQISDDIRARLRAGGFDRVEVRVAHHPAWSTDRMSAEGKRKLAAFGIAPPTPPEDVLCPRCASGRPRMLARFGSTACKALMVCTGCGEPFDYFKDF